MSAAGNAEQLYSRGRYRLEWDVRKDGTLRSPYLQIVWYDAAAGRNRSRSTATADLGEAERQLDKLYLERERGEAICPTCGQPRRAGSHHLLTTAIADYLVARESRPSYDALKARLAHVGAYLHETDQLATACEEVDEDWIDAFREWAIEIPVVSPNGKARERAPGTVEASVRILAAAINFAHNRKDTLFPAAFTARKPDEVSRSPAYRADVKTLAAMFSYALAINVKTKLPFRSRDNLLRFLRISVATWARPDAAHDFSTDRERMQWFAQSATINLNPKGRAQTKKYRPIIPAARQLVPHLAANSGFYVKVDGTVKSAFETMLDHLGLPRHGETGMKVIRRSMAKLARERLGERDWIEGQLFLGHRKHASVSDVYAPFEPGYLARALAVTEEIIDEIDALAPGAFHRTNTGLRLVEDSRISA